MKTIFNFIINIKLIYIISNINIRYNKNRMDHFIHISVSELSEDRQCKLSKVIKNAGRKMTTFLRHKPSGTLSNVGKVIYEVNNNFLKFFRLNNINDFIAIVTTDNKERFAVFFKNNSEKYWVAATQGHSGDLTRIENVEKYLLERVSDIPYLWHGTKSEYKDSIIKNGLSRCNRFHIHMIGSDENDETDYNHNAVSGYRKSSDILIRINVKEAEKCGIVFWKSINGVYLTRGNDNGIIPSDYLEVLTIN